MAKWKISPCTNIVGSCENDTGEFSISPSAEIGATYTITNNETGKSIQYTRVKNCITCNCNSIKYTKVYNANYVGNAEQTFNPAIKLGTISFVDTKCDGKVNLSAVCETPGEMALSVIGKNVYLNHIKANTTGHPRALRYYATVNGEKCDGDFVAQQCWRATDNGTDYYLDDKGNEIKENSSILFCSWQTGDEHKDGDTIKVSTMKLLSASASTGNNSYTALTITQSSAGNFVGVTGWNATFDGAGSWLKLIWEDGGLCKDEETGLNFGMIKYIALTECPDDSSINGYRSVVLTFGTDDSVISMGCNPVISHRDEECCKTWEVEVKQCKPGLSWYSITEEDGKGHSKTAMPLNGPSGKHDYQYHNCSE